MFGPENVRKMVKNVDQCFPNPKVTSSNVLFCPQTKDIQFTVTEDERNQKIFKFEKPKSENLVFVKKDDEDEDSDEFIT